MIVNIESALTDSTKQKKGSEGRLVSVMQMLITINEILVRLDFEKAEVTMFK